MSIFSRHISTSIIIDATPEQVWQVLTDFARYPDWNPFVIAIHGSAVLGEKLTITVKPAGQKPMNFNPTILACKPGSELRWLGQLAIPGLFAGEHIFLIEPCGVNQVRFTQAETFRGLLIPFLGSMIRATQEHFNEVNNALAQRIVKAN